MADNEQHEYFMQKALSLAECAIEHGDVPVGALIVKNGEIIAQAYNQREYQNDPTAHAEVIAIQKAAQVLDNWRLLDTTLYITKEPCIMCAGAMVHARIKTLVFGCFDAKYGAAGSVFQLCDNTLLNHRLEIISAVMHHACQNQLQTFFKSIRST